MVVLVYLFFWGLTPQQQPGWLFNATLTGDVISWRGRLDNAVGLDPKNSLSVGGALNHCATGPGKHFTSETSRNKGTTLCRFY